MNEVIIGIDLGTTNSAVGVVESGFPILLANDDNERIIPSAVWYGKEGEVEVGKKAIRRKNGGVGKVITSVKRLIGRRLNQVDYFPHRLQEDRDSLLVDTGEKFATPVEISSHILAELKRIAEFRLEHTVDKAVITVPAYFNDSQRAATKLAGEQAGLKVERILSEPTAAALSFGLDKLEEKSKVVVYDLGGGTFDVSLLEMNNGIFQVEATSGDTHLGGDDIDLAIAEWAWQQHANESLSNLESVVRERVLDEARKAKESLSSQEEVFLRIPFIRDNENLEVCLTQATFTKLVKPLIDRTLTHCRQILLDGDISEPKSQLSNIILVGGSSRIPQVRTAVEDFFSMEPDLSQHPDEAIALGAVIQAGILSGALKDIVLLDVTPLSLGIETYGGLMNVIIPRNTTIPCKAGEMFTNAVDSQVSMQVRVLQGEREMAKDNWQLGKVSVPFEATRKGQARVGVQFSINENGILEVLSRDTQTNIDTVLKIDSAAVDVDDATVENMVSESVEFAFSDMAERIFTEAKMKADELLPAVTLAIEQVGGQLEEKELSAIKLAKSEVEAAISSEDANTLKAAVKELDKATEYLATLLVEKAMEEALMKKLSN